MATPWSAGDRIVLYASDNSSVVDAQVVESVPQARSWEHQGQWLRPTTLTPGAENQFTWVDSVVINEIMYHAAPQFADGAQAFAESPEEWIELYNRGPQAIDISGWTLGGGIDYVMPQGTVIAAGGFLVVSNDAARLREQWPRAAIVGDFSGTLSNQGELMVLEDAVGNPADEVHYYDGGAWPQYADGGGSSLELRDPYADNSRPAAWTASDEDDEAPWVSVSYEGRARNPQGSADPTEWNELIIGLLDAGEFLLDDISVIEDPDGAAIERMQNGDFESGAAHWRFVGNHGQHGRTQVINDPDDPINHVLHVVATGATEHMSNHLETTFADNAQNQLQQDLSDFVPSTMAGRIAATALATVLQPTGRRSHPDATTTRRHARRAQFAASRQCGPDFHRLATCPGRAGSRTTRYGFGIDRRSRRIGRRTVIFRRRRTSL